ncbi:MAG: PorT family protein [Bacteroidales bacterium]|nr:PorT family protein [Bacteroidales bacterium]
MAGVAAVVAAVLLLRPVSRQEPDRLVQQTENPSMSTSSHSGLDPESQEPADGVFQTGSPKNCDFWGAETGGPELFFGSRKTNSGSANPSAGQEESARRLPQDSVSVAVADSASVTPGLPRSLLAEESREIPDQAGDDKKAVGDDRKVDGDEVRPLSELALADLPEEPERGRRTWSGRVALRVQAATAGRSLSGDAVSMNVPQTTEMGRWIACEDISGVTQDSFKYVGSSDSYVNNGELSGQQTIKWIYVREVAGTTNNLVLVPKAPAVPVALGVSLSLPLARSWSLSAGLDYAQRDGYRLYGDMPQSLTLHYLGVPVDLHYYFNPDSRWRFYLGAGLHAAKCIYASGGQPLKDPILFSGNLSAGTDFRIFPGVRVYLAPALTAPFNRSAYVNTWDDRPAFQLRAGLSFDLK